MINTNNSFIATPYLSSIPIVPASQGFVKRFLALSGIFLINFWEYSEKISVLVDFKANKAMFILTFFNIGYIWDIMGFYGESFRIMKIVHIDNTITLDVLRIQCIESMVFLVYILFFYSSF